MGSLIHRAMQMGLHRDPKHLPTMPLLQAELRRRLWATVLEMVVQSSLDSAMPPRISLDEFDTEAPSNYKDDELNESATSSRADLPSDANRSSVQLALLGLLPIRLRILHRLNDLHSEISYLDVFGLTSELTDAYRTCTDFMQHEESGTTPFHRNLVDLLVRRILIPLHYPFACQARTNPLFHHSVRVCLDTALSIISPPPEPCFSNLMTIGGGLFRRNTVRHQRHQL